MENEIEKDNTRRVARLKPVQSNPVVIPDQSDYATEDEFFEACRRQRRQVIPMNEEETMTDAEMNEALDALKDPKDARIKELEGAQSGLKNRILDAFKYKCSGLGPKMQHDLLAQVLDDLKIK